LGFARNFLLNLTYLAAGYLPQRRFAEIALLVLLHRCVSRKVTPLPLVGHIWRPLLASVAMAGFVAWFGSIGSVARILGGFLVYVLAGLTFKAFRFGEIAELIELG